MDASDYNRKIYRDSEKLSGLYYDAFDARTKKIIEMFEGFEGKLLDVGCGNASISFQLKQALSCEVSGAELIEGNVKKAIKKGIKAKTVDLNSEMLPFKSGSFQGVFAGEVLEHVIDSEGLLSEMKRVLHKDGTMVLTAPNIASWYNRLLMFFGYLPHFVESGSKKSYGTPYGTLNGHVKAFTKRSISEMLESNGFKVVKIQGSGFSRAGLEEYNKSLLKIGAPLFFMAERLFSWKPGLATNLIVKAVKK